MNKVKTLFLAISAMCIIAIMTMNEIIMNMRGQLRSFHLLSDRKNWDPDRSLDDNQTCQFPQPDPWDESILKYVFDTPPIRCRSVQPIFAYIDTNNILRVNESAMVDAGYDIGSVKCSYQEVKRIEGDDFHLNYSEVISISHETPGEKLESEIVIVKCANWLGFSIYNDVIVRPRRLRHQKTKKMAFVRPLNVLAFGIDSISRLNMMRQLPLTYKYLTRQMKSVVLHGMTRVGDNTYPNVMATLTGKLHLQRPRPEQKFDSWNLIWRNFSSSGYTTLFLEDEPHLGTFNYVASGFDQQPTDYYLRPFYLAIAGHWTHKLSSNLCFGSTLKIILHMNYLRDVLENSPPYFAYSFLTEISHDALNQISGADVKFKQFFERLYEGGFLDDTVLFVFGDHGHRFDAIRRTPIGRIESSMPFFSVYLPERIRQEYPVVYDRLVVNGGRLTSMLDVYETFVDIYKFSTIGSSLGQVESINNYGLSLFSEIPLDRSCESAGISEQFCMCSTEKELSLDDVRSKEAAEALVDAVNSMTSSHRNLCSLLKLHLLHNSYLLSDENKIRVVIETNPGFGIYEGLVTIQEGKVQVSNDISRINKYKGQDFCLTANMKSGKMDLRKFCYCI